MLLALLFYFGPVVLAGWGWMRWLICPDRLTGSSKFSLAGLVLATSAYLLGVGGVIYGIATGGFHHYDPRLMRIFAIGILLSFLGLILGVAGMSNRNPIRWHAPASSLVMLLLWFFLASLE